MRISTSRSSAPPMTYSPPTNLLSEPERSPLRIRRGLFVSPATSPATEPLEPKAIGLPAWLCACRMRPVSKGSCFDRPLRRAIASCGYATVTRPPRGRHGGTGPWMPIASMHSPNAWRWWGPRVATCCGASAEACSRRWAGEPPWERRPARAGWSAATYAAPMPPTSAWGGGAPRAQVA